MTVLVLLPGMDGTGELFAPFEAKLRVPFVRIAYPATASMDYLQLVEYVRQRLPVGQRFVLLGESFSGPVAIGVAAQRPPLLAGLVLCCTFARTPHLWTRHLHKLAGLLPWPPPRFAVQRLLCSHATALPVRDSLDDVLRRVPGPTIRHRLRCVLAADAVTELMDVQVPVLCLRAKSDRLVPPSAGELILRHVPRGRLEALAGPHLLLQTAAPEAARAVEAFMSELDAADTAYPVPPREEARTP